MDRGTLIQKLKDLVKEIKPTLVRKKEQVKGIIWVVENDIMPTYPYVYKKILKAVRKQYK